MLSVAEAQRDVIERAQPLPPEKLPLTSAALGLVLAEDVTSDLDMPPFDKALMDGFALRAADLPQGHGTLRVVEEIVAGQPPQLPLQAGQCARIMTGAALPQGADSVVMVERTQMLQGDTVQVNDRFFHTGQNVVLQGREMRQGQAVLAAGTRLRPQEFGVLAAVGRTAVMVHPSPRVAILSTGDELVEASQMPGPGQIRNSNGPMLAAQVCRARAIPRYLGIAPDCAERLRSLVAEGLQAPILVLSGGVSAGKRDLVPGILQELEVEALFHKVDMKPGKPVFCGSRGNTLVFGLPGNPVSAVVCFELFVRPAIRRLQGQAHAETATVQAALVEDFAYQTDRPTYHPAWLEESVNGWVVHAVPWFGSSDLRALTRANAFVLLAKGDHRYREGQHVQVLRVEDGD